MKPLKTWTCNGTRRPWNNTLKCKPPNLQHQKSHKKHQNHHQTTKCKKSWGSKQTIWWLLGFEPFKPKKTNAPKPPGSPTARVPLARPKHREVGEESVPTTGLGLGSRAIGFGWKKKWLLFRVYISFWEYVFFCLVAFLMWCPFLFSKLLGETWKNTPFFEKNYFDALVQSLLHLGSAECHEMWRGSVRSISSWSTLSTWLWKKCAPQVYLARCFHQKQHGKTKTSSSQSQRILLCLFALNIKQSVSGFQIPFHLPGWRPSRLFLSLILEQSFSPMIWVSGVVSAFNAAFNVLSQLKLGVHLHPKLSGHKTAVLQKNV